MFKDTPLPTNEELLAQCENSGVSILNVHDPETGKIPGDVQRQLQQLVINAETAKRARSLWLLALGSCIASIVSAAAAWYAAII